MGNKSGKTSKADAARGEYELVSQGYPPPGSMIVYYSGGHAEAGSGGYRIERYDPSAAAAISDAIRNLPQDLQEAASANFRILITENMFRTMRQYTSSPCIDRRLDPTETYVVYKIACFHTGREIMRDVAVLLTLHIQSSRAYIAEGATGQRIDPKNMRPDVKYCTSRAIVTGVQFLGNIINVETAYELYTHDQGAIISNFDSSFKYILGHEIHEPQFGQPGIGCVRGIHVFTHKKSALKYVLTGYVESMLTPILSALQTETRDNDLLEIPLPKRQPSNHDRLERAVAKLYGITPAQLDMRRQAMYARIRRMTDAPAAVLG
jgi:hypothetical protein